MFNIVIPMAGAGSRFIEAGYTIPKPLIPIHGVPMIKVVIDNLTPSIEHRFIFICQREHASNYNLEEKLSSWAPKCEIVLIDGLTEGAACTVLQAKALINNNNPLIIANSDQLINVCIDEYLTFSRNAKLDGTIMTMPANDPKWSYVELDYNNHVTRVVEKEVISNQATVGIYNYSHGCDFISAAECMIRKNLRVNNEFYVAPTYNQLINKGQKIGVYDVGYGGMHGLGTPHDLDDFISMAKL